MNSPSFFVFHFVCLEPSSHADTMNSGDDLLVSDCCCGLQRPVGLAQQHRITSGLHSVLDCYRNTVSPLKSAATSTCHMVEMWQREGGKMLPAAGSSFFSSVHHQPQNSPEEGSIVSYMFIYMTDERLRSGIALNVL